MSLLGQYIFDCRERLSQDKHGLETNEKNGTLNPFSIFDGPKYHQNQHL